MGTSQSHGIFAQPTFNVCECAKEALTALLAFTMVSSASASKRAASTRLHCRITCEDMRLFKACLHRGLTRRSRVLFLVQGWTLYHSCTSVQRWIVKGNPGSWRFVCLLLVCLWACFSSLSVLSPVEAEATIMLPRRLTSSTYFRSAKNFEYAKLFTCPSSNLASSWNLPMHKSPKSVLCHLS